MLKKKVNKDKTVKAFKSLIKEILRKVKSKRNSTYQNFIIMILKNLLEFK
jgi:hypothetical protein